MKNLNKLFKTTGPIHWVIFSLFLIIIIGFWYGYGEITKLRQQNLEQNNELSFLQGTLASTTSLLAEGIEETKVGFSVALENEKKNVTAIKEQLGGVESTVGTLEKLSKTDPELLQKYSKVFFLNEHYIPARLIDVQDKYKYIEKKELEVQVPIKTHLENMLEDALGESIEIYVMSAHRSFKDQQELKGQYTVVYGVGAANQFSADQGYSEHQLGTTVDLITIGLSGKLQGFDRTVAYTWLLDNAYKYGFILSYPKENTYYIFEPWHWRFVGIELATHLHNTTQNFYDLEQREIDEYLVNIFD
jgi:LAS superfamily LD-carboxypeptidase LdcB